MKAVLVRIGIDHSYGGWNAPADPATGQFVYVPIPENGGGFHAGCRRDYDEVLPATERLAQQHGKAAHDLGWPGRLNGQATHLDPDFEHLTYGDVGDARGAKLCELADGDLLVFYSGLRPLSPCEHRLIYAIVGIFVVKDVLWASELPRSQWHTNAHTRKKKRGASDIVVRAKREGSGRLSRYLPIGEYRNAAYRVRSDLLKEWGGLSVKDGYIQRSGRLPHFLKPERFYRWFQEQEVPLIQANNPGGKEEPDVHLPRRQFDASGPR